MLPKITFRRDQASSKRAQRVEDILKNKLHMHKVRVDGVPREPGAVLGLPAVTAKQLLMFLFVLDNGALLQL